MKQLITRPLSSIVAAICIPLRGVHSPADGVALPFHSTLGLYTVRSIREATRLLQSCPPLFSFTIVGQLRSQPLG